MCVDMAKRRTDCTCSVGFLCPCHVTSVHVMGEPALRMISHEDINISLHMGHHHGSEHGLSQLHIQLFMQNIVTLLIMSLCSHPGRSGVVLAYCRNNRQLFLLLCMQISINPTYHMIGKHALNIGKDLINIDKNGKVNFDANQT